MRRYASCATVMAVLACGELLGSAQTRDPLPSFELATVKASGPESGATSIRRLPGGRLVTSSTPLPMLIQWAYQLDDGGLLNVPKTIESLRFDIVAKAPEDEPFRMSDSGSLIGTRVTADMLAAVLSNQLGRPVSGAAWLSP